MDVQVVVRNKVVPSLVWSVTCPGSALNVHPESAPTARPLSLPSLTTAPPVIPSLAPSVPSPAPGVPRVAVNVDGSRNRATRGTPRSPQCARVDVYAEPELKFDDETPTLSLRAYDFLRPILLPRERALHAPASLLMGSPAIVSLNLDGNNAIRTIAELLSFGPPILNHVDPGASRSSSGLCNVFLFIRMPPPAVLGLSSSVDLLALLLPPCSVGACAEAEIQVMGPMQPGAGSLLEAARGVGGVALPATAAVARARWGFSRRGPGRGSQTNGAPQSSRLTEAAVQVREGAPAPRPAGATPRPAGCSAARPLGVAAPSWPLRPR